MKHVARTEAPWMVLVGPAGTGKTTLGQDLAARARRPFVDLDAAAHAYYLQAGWTMDRLRERIALVGRLAAEVEWEPARALAVARVVADHPGAIIALGAGHASYTDPGCLATVRKALAPCPDVVRVLPSPDRGTSLAVLRARCIAGKGTTWIVDGHDFLGQWLDDAGTEQLATRTIYTRDESPAQTAARAWPTSPWRVADHRAKRRRAASNALNLRIGAGRNAEGVPSR